MIRLTAERHIIPTVLYLFETFLVPVASVLIPITQWIIVLLCGLLAVVGELIRMVFEPFRGFLFSLVEDLLFLFEELDFCGDVLFLQLVLLVIQLTDCVCISVAAGFADDFLAVGETGACVFLAGLPVLEA